MLQLRKLKTSLYSVQKRFGCVALVLVLFLVLLTGCAPRCVEKRSALDIGSASMKIKTAKVDTCRTQVIGIIGHREIKVPFAENILDGQFTPGIRNRGIEVLLVLKKEGQDQGAKRFAGAATAAFREAQNAPQYLAEIKEKTEIPIRLISQDEEAILGYLAAQTVIGGTSGPFAVWDIGGNSMQIIFRDHQKHYRIYRGSVASISYKNQILEKIHHQPPGLRITPNPIGKQNLDAALGLAMNAASDIPEVIRQWVLQNDFLMIGIGGVHNQSIRRQAGNRAVYRQEDLLAALETRLDWTDSQIGGNYADTDVSNLILVLGFMKKLGIREVRLADVNLTDGILLDPAFWQ